MAEKSSSKNEGGTTQGSTGWLCLMAIFLLTSGIISLVLFDGDHYDEAWRKEVKLTYYYIGAENTKILYSSCDSWAESVIDYFEIRQLAENKNAGPMRSGLLKSPDIVKWILRRLILVIPVFTFGFLFAALMFYRGTLYKMSQDMMHVESQIWFEGGRLMMWCGVAYILMSPFSSLPQYGDVGYWLLGLSFLPLLTHIFKGRIDFLLPVLFVAGSLFLGPWNATIGLIFTAIGAYVLARQWPSNT